MPIKLNFAKLFVTIALYFLTACGYTLQGSGSILPPDVKKIQIPMVQNNSTNSSLTELVTEAIRDQFERYGVVTIVDNINDADAVLAVKILKLARKTRTSTSTTDTVQQFDSSLLMSGELKKITGQVLWRNSGFSISRTTAATSDTVVTSSAGFSNSNLDASDLSNLSDRDIQRASEQAALENIAKQAALKIYNDAVAPDF